MTELKLLSEPALKRLIDVATKPEFLEVARRYFPVRDRWRSVDNKALWRMILSQVCVVGSSAPWENLVSSGVLETDLSFSSLIASKRASQLKTIHRYLQKFGVRYVMKKADECRKSQALVRNLTKLRELPGGAKAYLDELASLPSDRARVHRMKRDWAYIKNKGSRDFLINLDLGRSLIAFDTRVLNVLEAAGVEVPADLQTAETRYAEMQDTLVKHVCGPANLTGAEFDRVLYRNYDAIIPYLRTGVFNGQSDQERRAALDAAKREGIVEGKRGVLRRLLVRAEITFSDDDRNQIDACDELETLDRWCENVIGACT